MLTRDVRVVLGGQHPVSFLDKKLCRLFDPRAGWRELPDMNVARCGAGATAVAGGMLIVGGESLSDNRDGFDSSGRGGGAVATPVRSSPSAMQPCMTEIYLHIVARMATNMSGV